MNNLKLAYSQVERVCHHGGSSGKMLNKWNTAVPPTIWKCQPDICAELLGIRIKYLEQIQHQ